LAPRFRSGQLAGGSACPTSFRDTVHDFGRTTLGDAPGLAKMFDAIQAKQQHNPAISGRDLTATMNSLLHSKPDSAPWNMVPLGETGFGHAVSKILNRPDLCDDLCANAIPWLAVVQGMMAAYFPNKPAVTSDQVH